MASSAQLTLGTRLNHAPIVGSQPRTAENLLPRIQFGEPIPDRYDPADPARSILAPTPPIH